VHRANFGTGADDLWIVTHMGTFHSRDAGKSWEHVMAGSPLTNLSFVAYDPQGVRLLAVAGARRDIYESRDGSQWTLAAGSPWSIRNVTVNRGRIFAVTDFSGIVAQPSSQATSTSASGDGNR
jgi:hypothetical protein